MQNAACDCERQEAINASRISYLRNSVSAVEYCQLYAMSRLPMPDRLRASSSGNTCRYSVSRCTGMKPASRMMRRSSSSVVQLVDAGGAHDVFFEHDGADVVAAEAQAHLADFQALRDPAGLHVLECCRDTAARSPASSGTRPRWLHPMRVRRARCSAAGSSRG